MQSYEEKARLLLDILLRPDSFSPPQEKSLAADLLGIFLPFLEEDLILMISDRVCALSPLPLGLLNRLVDKNQESLVLRILSKGLDFPDSLLLKIIEQNHPHTLRSIAGRRFVSPTISASILECGSPEEIEQLVRNQGASFSEASFQTLSALCETRPALQASLLNRPDLPAPVAFRLFWCVPSSLRRYIVTRFLSDSLAIHSMISFMPPVQMKGLDLLFSLEKINMLEKEEAPDRLLIETLASALCIGQKTAEKIVRDPGGEPLMAALKALRCSRKICENIIDFLIENSLFVIKDVMKEDLQGFFESLSYNKARVLILYWEWETNSRSLLS